MQKIHNSFGIISVTISFCVAVSTSRDPHSFFKLMTILFWTDKLFCINDFQRILKQERLMNLRHYLFYIRIEIYFIYMKKQKTRSVYVYAYGLYCCSKSFCTFLNDGNTSQLSSVKIQIKLFKHNFFKHYIIY